MRSAKGSNIPALVEAFEDVELEAAEALKAEAVAVDREAEELAAKLAAARGRLRDARRVAAASGKAR